ncbi:hypothetical protein HK103_002192 [Boothiomyces macroporosus]|uniref:BZIP domain-containing protein n=1 Tax=Boothiomyces macroporosus TaxID=261099 RepID=A0AAD5UDF5_9FUNG|nr:hypothetical protein HK103_002192 [Boothiomyces macroporosus]
MDSAPSSFEEFLQTEFPLPQMESSTPVEMTPQFAPVDMTPFFAPVDMTPLFTSVDMAHVSSVSTVFSPLQMARNLSTSGVSKKRREYTMNHQELLADVEERRRRNTESARRSRARKLERVQELERRLAESEKIRQEMAGQLAQLLAERQQRQAQQKNVTMLPSALF